MVEFDFKEIHMEDKFLEEQTIRGQKAAAKYADVSVRTIRNWKAAGMPMTKDGRYIKMELDIYKKLKKTDSVFITKEELRTLKGEVDSAIEICTSLKAKLERLFR